MIEARDLTKRYGDKLAVDHLSFTVEPGRVTGFLGPNGAGKSTTMRLILGLDHPQSGTATINGQRYADLAQPLARSVPCSRPGPCTPAGAPITTSSSWPRPRACRGPGSTRSSGLVGLTEVARKRTGGFSLGMGQRVGIAVALLGDRRS